MIEPWVLRGVAVVLTILSFMVVWSECLFFIKEPVLSIFAVFINLAKDNYDYAYIEVRKFFYHISRDVRKPVLRDSDKVCHKLVCAATNKLLPEPHLIIIS